jgi:putative restriction endonuclease
MKGVFTTRIDPSYDDLPETHYHFPHTYLNQVRSTVGDQIVYYEPGRTNSSGARGGRKAYFAVATVLEVVPDPDIADHYYAKIDNFLEFDHAVPFKIGEQTFERGLQKEDGSYNKGAFRRAVRNISDIEFQAILAAGFTHKALDFVPDAQVGDENLITGFAEIPAEFERPVVEIVQNRLFRDRAFARKIKQAYDRRCSFTGLRIINGLGRPEVQAAHIKPVASNGPDSVRNGLALSSTIHWLFDRGLISLTDDFEFILARNKVPAEISGLLNRDGRAIVPDAISERPHSNFLRHHRELVFKG